MRALTLYFSLAVSICLLPGRLGAQTPRDQARQADLNYVAGQLPKLHVNFFFQLNPKDFNNAVQALSAAIPSLSDAEFDVRLAQLVALAGDEHTSISLADSAAANAGFRQFPLLFRWLDDGVFVSGASAGYSRALGLRLVAVAGHPIDEVAAQLASVIPHSNFHWVQYMAQSYLRGQQILQGLGLAPATATTQLTFQDSTGQQIALDVSPSSGPLVEAPAPEQGPIPYYLQRATENYWFSYLAPLRLLYFKYNRCVDSPANPFASFAANLLNAFDSNPVDTLVFDFRGNTGGDSSLIQAVTDGLLQRLPAIAANPNFRVYVAIDKGTFSSGVDDAEAFKLPASQYPPMSNVDPSKVIFVVGEPTGGAPGGYGDVRQFVLPNSKLDGIYSTQFFPIPDYITPNTDAGGPSFAPDIAISLRSSDFFARHDPVLAAIVARATSVPPGPSGALIVVNGASFRAQQGLAPGSFASGFGNFQTAVDAVSVNGQTGQVVSAGPTQVNFVMPASLSPDVATISMRTGSTEVASGQATVTAAGPGLFVLRPTDPSQPGAVLNQDSTINGASARAAAASVLQIFATGYGPVDSSGHAAAQVLIGGVPAEVIFSGPTPQFPGLWQINARVPAGLSGQVNLFVIASNIASNGVTVWVQ